MEQFIHFDKRFHFLSLISIIIVSTIHVRMCAQLTANGNVGSAPTQYTNGSPNDDIFIWCGSGNNGSLTFTPTSGVAPFSFNWFQFSSASFSWNSLSTNSGATSTISSLSNGGYRVVATDANGLEAGCAVAWVWNLNVNLNAAAAVSGCNDAALNCVVPNLSFTYYHPPSPLALIDANTEITVCFSGTHTWVSDLGFYLQAPISCGSVLIPLSPNPGGLCNAGNNFNNLCFTTENAPNFDVCSQPTPLSGTFDSYQGTPINWSPLYGCNAAQSGWTVRVFDCVNLDVGSLTNATISFSNLPSECGSGGIITYNSGNINSAIQDNACSVNNSSSFSVPPSTTLTTPIVLNASVTSLWTTNGTSIIAQNNANSTTAANADDGEIFNFSLNVNVGSASCTFNDDVVFSNPPTFFSYPNELCEGGGIVAVSLSGASSGVFSAVPSGLALLPNGNIDLNSSNPGTYVVSLSPSSGGCAAVFELGLSIQPSPIDVTLNPNHVCEGDIFNGDAATADMYEYLLNGAVVGAISSSSSFVSSPLLSGDQLCVRGYEVTAMVMDGIFNEVYWGDPIAQANSNLVSSFGIDNHLDALYIAQEREDLYLGIAGSLVAGSNNRIFLFLDVGTGGFNSLSSWVNRSQAPYFSMSSLNGNIQFDDGFSPEYILAMNTAIDGTSYWDLYDMVNNVNQFLGSTGANFGYTSAGSSININQGYEWSIPLSALGSPVGQIGVFAMLVNDPQSSINSTTLSNQFLTPADNGAQNYGNASVDFSQAPPNPVFYLVGDANCFVEECLILDVPTAAPLPIIDPLCQNTTSVPVLNTTLGAINGTWVPSVIDVSAAVSGAVYTFTPNANLCATGGNILVDVNAPASPVFVLDNTFCQGETAPLLPSTSGAITGNWLPANISTGVAATVAPVDYIFTPNADECALSFTHTVTVTADQTPTFNFLTAYCQNATAPVLPINSLEGIPGAWSAMINTANLGNQTLTFTPNVSNPNFQCPISTDVTISITNGTPATFNALGPVCSNSVVNLPSTSVEGFTGTWSPNTIDLNNTNPGGANYTFTPDPDQCANPGTLNVVVLPSVIPTFNISGNLCQNSAATALPVTSNNAIDGTWIPSTVQTSSTGTSTYTFTPLVSECANPLDIQITIDLPIDPIFNINDQYCEGAAAAVLPLMSNNAVSGMWLPNVINTGIPGSADYVFSPASNECANSYTLTVMVDAEVTPTFNAIGPLCVNSPSVVLPLTSLEGVNGSWNQVNVNTGILGTTNYSFIPSVGECAANGMMSVEIEDAITPLFDPIGNLCQNQVAPILNVVSNNGFTGSWNPSVVNMNQGGLTTYNFTADPGQCSANTTMDVNVALSLSPVFSVSDVYCQDEVADVLPDIADNGVQGTWMPNVIQTALPNMQDYIFTPDANECADALTYSVTVNAPQNSSIVGIPNSYCQNDVPLALPNVSDEGFNGSWNPAMVNTNNTGIYTFVFTPNPTECALPFSLEVEVLTPEPSVFANIQDVYCQGDLAPVLPSVDDNGVNGNWFPASIITMTSENENYLFTPTPGQCNANFILPVQVNALPIPSFSTSFPAITCNEPDVDVIANGGVSYSWSNGGGNSDVITVSDDTNYEVTVTDINGCNAVGFISVPFDTSTFCLIDALTTTLNCGVLDIDLNVIGGASYTWYNGLGNSAMININTPGIYEVNVVHDNGCDRDVSITIDQDLTPPNVVINNITGEDTLTCTTDSIILEAQGGVSYAWDNGLGSNNPLSVVAPGLITVVATGSNFCTATASYAIEQDVVLPSPVLLASDDTLDCFVDSIQLVVSGGVLYSWNMGGVNDTLYAHLPGNYVVTVTGSNGCSDVANWIIGWNRFFPDSMFTYSPTTVMDEEATVYLDGPSIPNIIYTWSVDGDDVHTGGNLHYTFASFQPGNYQVCLESYFSDLCKSDTCQWIEVKESLQLFVPNSFTPGNDGVNDGFYPVISNIELLKIYHLSIFNRWGDLIFESYNPEDAWDGGYLHGGDYHVPDGVYPYILQYQTIHDVELKTVKGEITLTR